MKKLSPTQKAVLVSQYPELKEFFAQQDSADLIQALMNNQRTSHLGMEDIIRIVKEAKREVAIPPDLVETILEQATPRKGEHYDDGEPGEDGDDGDDYVLTDEDKAEIAAQIEVPVVEKIIEIHEVVHETPVVKEVAVKDTPKDLAAKLNTLNQAIEAKVIKDLPTLKTFLKEAKDKKLFHVRDIDGMPFNMKDQRWHGGGISNITGYIVAGTNVTISGTGTILDPYVIGATGGGGSYSILTAVGAINDSNVAFTFLQLPTELVINGASYIQTGGAITWSWNAGSKTVTLSSPIGTGGSIYGRV